MWRRACGGLAPLPLTCATWPAVRRWAWLADARPPEGHAGSSLPVRAFERAAPHSLHSAPATPKPLAPGIADAYWEYRLKPWDMAAGVLVVEEAGGTVTTMDGRAFSGGCCGLVE